MFNVSAYHKYSSNLLLGLTSYTSQTQLHILNTPINQPPTQPKLNYDSNRSKTHKHSTLPPMSRPLENLAMPSNYRAKFDDNVARIPMIRHRVLEHITPPQYREEVKDFLDDLESMCADGWALYKYARARERQSGSLKFLRDTRTESGITRTGRIISREISTRC
jgi:hypothetical protein